MILIIATLLVTIAVAVAAAFFSIYGLSQIFAGAFIAVVVMGAALEAGKLVATLLLHTYWDRMSALLKTYLTTAVILLMVITSGGVYGFLSAAYQKEQIPLQQVNAKIELLDAEYQRKTLRLAQMDKTIAEINPDYITKRLEEKAQQADERLELTNRVNNIEHEKLELVSRKIDTEAHIGPIIYMAEVFDKTSNDAANYLIILLIVVFDPLAVALTISISSMIQFRKEDSRDIIKSTPDGLVADSVSQQVIDVDATTLGVDPIHDQLEFAATLPASDDTSEDQSSQSEFIPIDIDDIVARIEESQQHIDVDKLAELVALKMAQNTDDSEPQSHLDPRTSIIRQVRENVTDNG